MKETCQQYVKRRLSEGWKVAGQFGHTVFLSPPDGAFLRPVDLRNDVETLRPNAAGDMTSIDNQYPTSGEHWDKVDEVTADDNSTYVYTGISYRTDLYNLPASSIPDGATINFIKIYIRCKSKSGSPYAYPSLKSDSKVTTGTKITIGTSWHTYSQQWDTNPADGQAWEKADINALQIGVRLDGAAGYSSGACCTQVYVEIDYTVVVAPTVTTQAATNVQATTATGNGTVTDNGGENPDDRRIEWGTSSGSYPNSCSAGGGGTGAFSCGMTGLPTGTTIYCRAKAHNSAGWGYGGEVSFLTKPAAPTNVQATDGAHTDKVVITWTKSTGATGYQVYRDGTPLGWLGDVATYDDTGAGAPSITPGAAAASDGFYADKVALSLSGQSANNGATHTYKVRAKNATGESVDSGTNTGYRGVGSLTYQWQRSAADSDADYSNIAGATTASYDDTGAPADGSGRYYRCVENATGATQQISAVDRGYRAALTYKDIATRFRLRVQGYSDITTRFRLWAQTYKDAATRFFLGLPYYKDIAARFRLWVRGFEDVPTRFKLTVQNYKDAATRFQLVVTKDITTRFKLSVQAYKDAATRFKLWAQSYQDVAARFRLNLGYYKDITTRFILEAQAYQDVATRFKLEVQAFKDIATRFKLTAQGYRDTAARFFLGLPSYKDIATRFKLTVQQYSDIATRFKLTVQSYRDIVARFKLWARGYRDTATRFILNALDYQDIAARFNLTVRAYRDIATRFKLIAQRYTNIATRFRLSIQTYQDVSTRFFLYQPTWEEIQIQKAVTALEAEIEGLELEPRAHFRI